MGAVRRLVDELRARGITVHEWSGWDGRGNEGVTQIDPKGAVLHHTATGYGSAFPDLVVSTQAWARGNCLCNFAGNADGSLTVVASGLAWHAGPGAGPSLGPLAPYRSAMNRYTVGLEIVYPGNSPMTDAQYRAALVFARAVADLFGGGDIEVVRAHGETNGRGGDGKWDPGWAPGQTIDMAKFRREAATIQEEDDVSAQDVAKIMVPVGYDPKKPQALPLTEHLRGTNYGTWENNRILIALAAKLDTLGSVVAELADKNEGVELTDEQAERLGTQIEAMLSVGLDELVEKLDGLSKDDMREVLRETRWGVLPGSTNPGGGL